jgi:outer membrane protein
MFKLRIAKYTCAAMLFFSVPSLGAAETLSDSLRNAYKNSGLLAQNRALLRAADEKVAGSVAALRPIIKWSSTYSHSASSSAEANALSAKLSASWLLYDFGKSKLNIQAQKETVLATRQLLISIEQTVLLRTVKAHMKYRSSIEFVTLRAANVELIEQELRAAKDRFEVGEVTRTDVALAEARLASARASFASAEGDLTKAAAEFRAVVGLKPGNLITPSGLPDLPDNVDAAIEQARVHHPALKRIQHLVSAAEINVKIAQSSNRFKVNGSANLTDTNSTSNVNRDFNLTVDGPIYSGGAIASASRAAMAQRDAKRAELHIGLLDIEQEVRNSFVLLDVARASGKSIDRQIEAASVAFRGVREEAALGARTTLDVLNAEQELLDARVTRISTSIDEQIAAYTVLASIGKLTAVSLELGVKTYDPIEYYNLVKTAPISKSKQGKALDRVLKGLVGN